MATIPFALSISHFVNSVGATAGFAAIIGLAVLVLLYFAQARETATLREHVDQANERIGQLEGRIAQLLRAPPAGAAQALRQPPVVRAPTFAGAPVAAPVGAPAGATAAGAPATQAGAAAAGIPAGASGVPAAAGLAGPRVAPAGVGAPALSAATRLIPTDFPPDATALAEPPPPVVEPSGVPAAAGNGHASPGASAPPAPPASPSPPRRAQIRTGAAMPPPPPARRPGPLLDELDEGPISVGRLIAYVVGALVLIGVLVFALLSLTSGGSSTPPAGTSARTTNAPAQVRRPRTVVVNPSAVTVSVLNGTATLNVAKTVAGRLGVSGFKPGLVANAPDQTHASTVVAYLPGFRRDALAVAKSLGLTQSAVAPVDATTQTVACPQATACTTNVVVTVGSDLGGGATVAPGTSTGAGGGQTVTGSGTSASGAASTTTAP